MNTTPPAKMSSTTKVSSPRANVPPERESKSLQIKKMEAVYEELPDRPAVPSGLVPAEGRKTTPQDKRAENARLIVKIAGKLDEWGLNVDEKLIGKGFGGVKERKFFCALYCGEPPIIEMSSDQKRIANVDIDRIHGLRPRISEAGAKELLANIGSWIGQLPFNQAVNQRQIKKFQAIIIKSMHAIEKAERQCRMTARKDAISNAHRGHRISLHQVRKALKAMGIDVSRVRDRLERFPYPKSVGQPSDYFILSENLKALDPAYQMGAKLQAPHLQLLADYYRRECGANIVIPGGDAGAFLAKGEFTLDIERYLAPLKAEPGDVRCAFLVTVNESPEHTVPVIFIKENGKQAILIADSLGNQSPCELSKEIATVLRGQDIDVYRSDEIMQRSPWGCKAHSVKVAVAMTRREMLDDGTMGDYSMPSVCSEMKEWLTDAAEEEGPLDGSARAVNLPAELAMLSERTAAIKAQVGERDSEERNRVLRDDKKKRTFNEKYDAYSPKFALVTLATAELDQRPAAHHHADYLRQKGLHYSKIEQIEFYNQQLKDILGPDWDARQQSAFAKLLKKEMRPNGSSSLPAAEAEAGEILPPGAMPMATIEMPFEVPIAM